MDLGKERFPSLGWEALIFEYRTKQSYIYFFDNIEIIRNNNFCKCNHNYDFNGQ